MILALKEFYVNQESPAPFISTKNIVTTGIFRFTRNPMYLSFLVSTLGVSIILFSLGILVGSIIGIILIHKLVVIFEEKKLISIEGYENYFSSIKAKAMDDLKLKILEKMVSESAPSFVLDDTDGETITSPSNSLTKDEGTASS